MQASTPKKPHINVDYFEDLTGDISRATQDNIEEIGARIRNIRNDKGLSLDEMSKMTGFSVELLADIESNQVQPQLGTIIKLSKALDSAFGRLVSGVGDRLYSITRKNEQKIISRSTAGKGNQHVYTYKSLAHEGEEFIYVLEGTVSLTIGDDAFSLDPGDSVYYLSTTPHLIAAQQNQATILAVMYEG